MYFDRLLTIVKSDGSASCTNTDYDACMYDGLEKHMINSTESENGCTTPWIINTNKICKKSTNIKNACMIAVNHVKNQSNDCGIPCETLGISLGANSYSRLLNDNTIGKLVIGFPSRILITEEKYLFTFQNLVAEIGGLLGLIRNIFWIVMLFFSYAIMVFTHH